MSQNPKRKPGRYALDFSNSPSRTVSEPGARTPMDVLVRRMMRGELVPGTNRAPLPPGDYTGVPNLMESMNLVRRAQDQFNALPAGIRKEFDNDPVKFHDFLMSKEPKDREKAVEMGFRKAPEPPKYNRLHPDDIAAIKGDQKGE